MPNISAATQVGGALETSVTRAPRSTKTYALRTPLGRLSFTRDRGEGKLFQQQPIISHLEAVHKSPEGDLLGVYDLGSGLVTNIGVNCLANDISWATATLKAMAFMGIGTGATAASVNDVVIQTQTAAATLTGSTNGFMAATLSLVQPNVAKYVATFTANGAISATEFGLFNNNFLPVNIVSTGTTYTATGAGFTTITAPPVQSVIVNAATAVNTVSTTAMGLVTASSATTATVLAWNTQANAAASTPTNATAAQNIPALLDHRIYGVITLASADTLQLSYSLTLPSGG